MEIIITRGCLQPTLNVFWEGGILVFWETWQRTLISEYKWSGVFNTLLTWKYIAYLHRSCRQRLYSSTFLSVERLYLKILYPSLRRQLVNNVHNRAEFHHYASRYAEHYLHHSHPPIYEISVRSCKLINLLWIDFWLINLQQTYTAWWP